jgi:hypothetical protein
VWEFAVNVGVERTDVEALTSGASTKFNWEAGLSMKASHRGDKDRQGAMTAHPAGLYPSPHFRVLQIACTWTRDAH